MVSRWVRVRSFEVPSTRRPPTVKKSQFSTPLVQPARDTTLHRTCLRHIPISAAPPPRMTSSFASDAPPTGRHRAWNFPYNGWILLSDSDQSEESRGLVGLSSARSSRFVWLEAGARTCLRHIPISAAPPPRMTSSFASDAPPTGRHRAWNFPYNGWILLSDSDQSVRSSRHATRGRL